jgi:hypothetical protein
MTIPHVERLHTKIWLAASQPGALDMRHWTCSTPTCRGGWINLIVYGDAHPEGSRYSTSTPYSDAAEAAYLAHGYDVGTEEWYRNNKLDVQPWWSSYIPNADALAKLRALAMMECAGIAMSLTFCSGCNSEIDPYTCHCGSHIDHSEWEGHKPVPMGCQCYRECAGVGISEASNA